MLFGRIAITLLVVGYVYRKVDWGTLAGTLRLTDPARLLLAAAIQGTAAVVAATRWRLLLGEQGIPMAWRQAARLTMIGLFFNVFLLGSIGGDAARFVGAFRHDGRSKARAALSLAQDRVIGLGALLLLLSCALLLFRTILASDRRLEALALVVFGGCAAFLLGAAVLALLGPAKSADREPAALSWRSVNLDLLRSSFPRRTFGAALGLSLVNHGLSIAAAYEAAHASGIALSPAGAALVLEATALALSLPITVAGLGVRDGMLLWLLGLLGFHDTGSAVRLSACLLGIGLLWALIGGVLFYMPSPRKP